MAVCRARNINSKTKTKKYIFIEIVEINGEVLLLQKTGSQSLVRKENSTKAINSSLLHCPMYK